MSEEEDVKNNETSEESSTEEELETEEVEEEVEEETDEQPNSLEARLAEVTEDNRRQKDLLDQLMQLGVQNQGQKMPVQTVEDDDDDDIDPAVARRLKKMQAQATQQVQGVVGGVLEEMDRSAILSSPRAALYRKYEQKVENYRKQMYQQGRYFKREEALGAVLLSEEGFGKEQPKKKVKKVVKQKSTPAGETQKATTETKKEQKSVSLRDRLANAKF